MENTELAIINDSEYKKLLKELKERVRSSQLKAAVSVNREMLLFYWSLGEDIVKLEAESKWGTGFYYNLSSDLKKEIPNIKGFSVTNLKYMKRFYESYSYLFYPQAVDELGNKAEHNAYDFIFNIPWGHHRYIIDRCNGNTDKA